jgi:hypothetical protein
VQTPVARDGLSADQVVSLIRDTSGPKVRSGLEVIGLDLNVIEDITDDFEGGEVSRSGYATLHGSSTLYVARELDWGTALVRPYYRMTGYTPTYGTLTARFNLGAYLTSTPKTQGAESPVTHEVEGYDVLHMLNSPVGEAYTIETGTGYLAAITTILTAQGIVAYFIDQTQSDKILASPKSWAMDDHTTWLNIINDLAASVGYQGVWSDWDGRIRVQPYQAPVDRAVEWVYNDNPAQSMIAPDRSRTFDWFDAPNRWVFFWDKDPTDSPPVVGNGIYVYVNQLAGPTSVAERGRVISAKPEQVTAVDHNALVAYAQRVIDADLRLKTSYEVRTAPNPLSWHFDKYTLSDGGLGPIADVLGSHWTLPLNGEDMSQEWTRI